MESLLEGDYLNISQFYETKMAKLNPLFLYNHILLTDDFDYTDFQF